MFLSLPALPAVLMAVEIAFINVDASCKYYIDLLIFMFLPYILLVVNLISTVLSTSISSFFLLTNLTSGYGARLSFHPLYSQSSEGNDEQFLTLQWRTIGQHLDVLAPN